MTTEELDQFLEQSPRAQKAMAAFYDGYNCAQAIVLAFEDLLPLEHQSAMMLSCSFGGGMGRLREVCGSMSGVFLVLGMLYGYDNPKDPEAKKQQYERVQLLASRLREIHGSIVCRELLGLSIPGADAPTPSQRTPEYYAKRPCPKMIGSAAAILEQYIAEHPFSA